MESDLQQHHHQNQMNSGLTRYRSAPSSYFANIIDREFCEEFFNRPSSPETERIFARFIADNGGGGGGGNGGTEVTNTSEVVATEASNQQTQFMASMNNEAAGVLQQQQQQNNYGSASQNFYQGPPRPPLPNSSVEGSYSMGLDRLPQMKTGGGGNNSSLIRHSSSPAGLFANINVGEGMYLLYFPTCYLWFLEIIRGKNIKYLLENILNYLLSEMLNFELILKDPDELIDFRVIYKLKVFNLVSLNYVLRGEGILYSR